jgi:hypothetical protein
MSDGNDGVCIVASLRYGSFIILIITWTTVQTTQLLAMQFLHSPPPVPSITSALCSQIISVYEECCLLEY